LGWQDHEVVEAIARRIAAYDGRLDKIAAAVSSADDPARMMALQAGILRASLSSRPTEEGQ
jgi:hypothetical protein